MSDEKPKPVAYVNYILYNSVNKNAVQNMSLIPRDVEVLNKVFTKHKIPLVFLIQK